LFSWLGAAGGGGGGGMGSEGDGTAGEFNGKPMWWGDLIGSVILIISKSFRLLTNSLLILIVAILVVGIGT